MRRSIVFLAGGLVALALVACSPAAAPPSPTTAPKPAAPAPAQPTAAPAAPAPTAAQAAAPAKTGQTRVVTFAGINALTGRDTAYGQRGHQGAALAVKTINDAGGFTDKDGNKYTLKLTANDMAEDRNQAISLVRQASDNKEVLATIGPTPSQGFLAVVPVAGQIKMPVIGIGSGAPVKEWNPWVVRNSLVSEAAAPVLMKTLKEKLNLQKVALIYDQTQDANAGEVKIIRDNASQWGIQVVAAEAFKGGDQDFTTQLTTIKASGVEWIGVYGATPEAGRITRQMADLGMKLKMFGGFSTLLDANTWDIANGATNGAYTWTGVDINTTDATIQDYVKRYKATFTDEPTSSTLDGYDAVYAAVDAIKRSGAYTGSAEDREKFRAAVTNTAGAKGIGTITWKNPPSGDNQTHAMGIVQVTGRGEGKPVN